ncbi:MAG: tetratricopeptide repeat protein [Synechococcaceae cyanobacterium SM1_2_3]|nr:tetratricopeptide repeat protein [Synechococcaceae cyanobacterium SM1_2_3]
MSQKKHSPGSPTHPKSKSSPKSRNAAVSLLQSLTPGNQPLTVQVNGKPLALPQALALAEQLGNAGQIQAAALVYQQLLEQAAECHRSKRLDDAEAVYRQVFEAQPTYIDALHLIGVIYSQRGDHVTSERLIRQALRENPQAAVYQNNLGKALQGQGRLEEAADSYQRTVELNPEHVLAWNNLGKVCMDLAKWDEAIAAFRRAVALRPDFNEAQRNLDDAQQRQKGEDSTTTS